MPATDDVFINYHKKMDPLEVPTDAFVKVQALKTGGLFLARRVAGGRIIIRIEDTGEERLISLRTFGKLYRKPDRKR